MQFHLTEKKKRRLLQSRPAQNKKAKLSGETASPLLNIEYWFRNHQDTGA